MAKLTKAETKTHNQIKDLIHSDRVLTFEEKVFVLENYHEGSTTNNSELGAFFTPYDLASDFTIDAQCNGSVIDLCAGIGMLTFCMVHHWYFCKAKEFTCVEFNHSYYELGKRIVPEANWIHGDALTTQFDKTFDMCISNPPFGKIKTSDWKGKYTGSEFEYKVISRASEIARFGAFIIPQQSAPFRYSGKAFFERTSSTKHTKFLKDTGIILEPGVGIDTGVHINEWKGVAPMCEVVQCEFSPKILFPTEKEIITAVNPTPIQEPDNFTFRIE